MEQARDPRRSRAQSELDDILREARESRQRFGQGAGADDAPAAPDPPRPPDLKVIRGGAPESIPEVPDVATEIRFEAEEFHLAEPSDARPRPLFEVTLARSLAVLGLLVAGFLWMRWPTGFPIETAPAQDARSVEADMRRALILTSQRVDAFVRDRARTPMTLDEAGPPASDLIGYERVAEDHYRLEAPGPNGRLILDSNDSRARFLGDGRAPAGRDAGGTP